MIARIEIGFVIGTLLNMVKKEMNTTNAKARSVPVLNEKLPFFSASMLAIIAFEVFKAILLKVY
jgi:hypothetical protein